MSKGSGNRKFLFICETPLQVLNACRFVLSDMEKSAGCSDICVFHLFRGAAETAERLKQAKIFSCVAEIAAFPEYGGIRGKMSTLCRMLMPRHTLKKYAINMDIGFLKGAYTHVILCHTTPTARAVRQCFRKRPSCCWKTERVPMWETFWRTRNQMCCEWRNVFCRI